MPRERTTKVSALSHPQSPPVTLPLLVCYHTQNKFALSRINGSKKPLHHNKVMERSFCKRLVEYGGIWRFLYRDLIANMLKRANKLELLTSWYTGTLLYWYIGIGLFLHFILYNALINHQNMILFFKDWYVCKLKKIFYMCLVPHLCSLFNPPPPRRNLEFFVAWLWVWIMACQQSLSTVGLFDTRLWVRDT